MFAKIYEILKNKENIIEINFTRRFLLFTFLGLFLGTVFYIGLKSKAVSILIVLIFIVYCPCIVIHELLHAYGHSKYSSFQGEIIIFNKDRKNPKYSAKCTSYCYNTLQPCYSRNELTKIVLYPLVVQIPISIIFTMFSFLINNRYVQIFIILFAAVFFISGSISDFSLALKIRKLSNNVKEIVVNRHFEVVNYDKD